MKAEYLMNQLFELGYKMRLAQRAYFKTRSPRDLAESKKYEKQFDTLLFNVNALKEANKIES